MGEMEYRQRVAVALRSVRDYSKLSQAELAALAGVNASTVSRYEAGEVEKPNAEQLVLIARALGVPLELLLDPPGYEEDVKLSVATYYATRRALREPS